MSSTASNCGLWKEFIAAFIRQFPNEEELPDEEWGSICSDIDGVLGRMANGLWGASFEKSKIGSTRFLHESAQAWDEQVGYADLLMMLLSSMPWHTGLPRERALWLMNNQVVLKQIIREHILFIDACYLESDLGVFSVPEGYDHETDLRNFLKDHHGDFMFISPEFGKKGVPARVEPGRTIRVKLYRQPKGSRVGREGVARFLQRQRGNLFLGAHGLALICVCTNWAGPNNAWTCSLDEADVPPNGDSLDVPAFGRFFPGGGWRLDVRSLDPTADPHARAHYIFGFTDVAVEERGN